MRELDLNHQVAFSREFKEARATALLDSECFEELLFVLERLGSFLTKRQADLSKYRGALGAIAKRSALAIKAAANHPDSHLTFGTLFEHVRAARNQAMHEGVAARHLSRNAQELALIMEDALMATAKTANDFMVRNPTCAELWQPLSAIRRTMLLNAFSYLPYEKAPGIWRLIADRNLVEFLRVSPNKRDELLVLTLEDAMSNHGLKDTEAHFCDFDTPLKAVISNMNGHSVGSLEQKIAE